MVLREMQTVYIVLIISYKGRQVYSVGDPIKWSYLLPRSGKIDHKMKYIVIYTAAIIIHIS